jgi:membrane-bound inhibitor of C-type lysozyme
VLAIQANSQTFKCDNNTEVVAFYGQENGRNVANLKITSPMLGLNQAAMVLKQDVSGSGNRYTLSNATKTTMYDWGVKGAEGALTVTSQGRDYNFVCNAI